MENTCNQGGAKAFTIVIISIIIILSSRWIVAQNNRSTVKLDSSKWNRIWSSPYLPNYVVIYLWYILSPILGRKRNGCLGRELRSGIVLLEPSKVLFVLQHWSLQGEISSLCLARNSFSLDSEVFALVHNWQRRSGIAHCGYHKSGCVCVLSVQVNTNHIPVTSLL